MVTEYQFGDDQIGYVLAEGTYGVPADIPAAANAFRARKITLTPVYDRKDPGDRRGTFSALERVAGRHHATWSVSSLFRPSGTIAVAPRIGPLLKLVFGTETIVPATSVAYTQLKDRSAQSAGIWAPLTAITEYVRGCVAQQLRIRWSGTDFVTIEVSGIAKEYGLTAPTTATNGGTTSTFVAVSDGDLLDDYSMVQINSTGSTVTLSAVNKTTNIATLQTARSWATGQTIVPYLPTPTYAGDPIFGTKGSCTISTAPYTIMEGEVSISTGLDVQNNEFGYDSPTQSIATGKWDVKGTLTLAVKKSQVALLSEARRQVQKTFSIVIGDTSTKRMTLAMNQVEMDPSALNIPDSGMATVQVPFVALGSTGEDNLTITLD